MKYISGDEGDIDAIINMKVVDLSGHDCCLGAYYGHSGGGMIDGGFFEITLETGLFQLFDFMALDDLNLIDPVKYSTLNSLMQEIWELVTDDTEDELVLTDLGSNIFNPNSNGIWMDSDFDCEALGQISEGWAINLRFDF
jgi:hypothetical protein|tara:strand:+ start:786 stop:1205 length:420 start_codon:yes stop_codon:yes gene_type:complete